MNSSLVDCLIDLVFSSITRVLQSINLIQFVVSHDSIAILKRRCRLELGTYSYFVFLLSFGAALAIKAAPT